MANALPRLLAMLETSRRAASEADLEFARRGAVDATFMRLGEQILSDEGRELFEEAKSRGELSDVHEKTLTQHFAWLAFELLRARARPRLAAWLRTPLPVGSSAETPAAVVEALMRGEDGANEERLRQLESSLAPLAPQLAELRQRMDEAFSARMPVSPGIEATSTLAETLLRDTHDAWHEMAQWVVRHRRARGANPAYELFLAARRHELDGVARAQRRLYRIASGFRALGFEADMNARLRAGVARGWLAPASTALAITAPGDVHVLVAGFEYGALSDVLAAEALGQALALSLSSPALPWAVRTPVLAEVPRAIGGLAMQLRADASYLRAFEGHSRSDAEALARHAAVLMLATVRSSAAVTLALHSRARSATERVEHLVVGLERAWGVHLPAGIASWLGYDAPCAGVDVLGRAAGVAAHNALRERFDEDWYRNPRAAEPIRGLCARGGDLGIAGMCEELGCQPRDASARLLELLS